jgi:hypothetical protein
MAPDRLRVASVLRPFCIGSTDAASAPTIGSDPASGVAVDAPSCEYPSCE